MCSWRAEPTCRACCCCCFLLTDHPTASIPVQVCEDCPNVKLVRETDALTVSVEPGMADGHIITFFEEGEPIIDGERSGCARSARRAAAAAAAAAGAAAAENAAAELLLGKQLGIPMLPHPACVALHGLIRPPPQWQASFLDPGLPALPSAHRRAWRPARRAAHAAAPHL